MAARQRRALSPSHTSPVRMASTTFSSVLDPGLSCPVALVAGRRCSGHGFAGGMSWAWHEPRPWREVCISWRFRENVGILQIHAGRCPGLVLEQPASR